MIRNPRGKESPGTPKNSGKPPSTEPERNSLSRSPDLIFGTSSSLGIRSKMLSLVKDVWDDEKHTDIFLTERQRGLDSLQTEEKTRVDMSYVIKIQ